MLSDTRPPPSSGHGRSIEGEARPFDVGLAENRIVNFIEVPRLEEMGIAHEVSTGAHYMRRHFRRLQAMLDRFRFLFLRPGRDRSVQLNAISQPPDYRVEFCVAEISADHNAQRLPGSWSRRVDRDPSIRAGTRK